MEKDLLSLLNIACEKYSAAGDEKNTRRQHTQLANEARAIIKNQICPLVVTVNQQLEEAQLGWASSSARASAAEASFVMMKDAFDSVWAENIGNPLLREVSSRAFNGSKSDRGPLKLWDQIPDENEKYCNRKRVCSLMVHDYFGTKNELTTSCPFTVHHLKLENVGDFDAYLKCTDCARPYKGESGVADGR